ncbi:hypothetical protein HK100_002965 [Physocladia obscura]|uniref:Methyltransferase domain-containing protein n=1 Tax=Physocladia obscura TaxID=109957 RepID=A0AAD5SVJ7_9FUNG|nr:hypothetical protein HK100_002965 [Physocladia obscura]
MGANTTKLLKNKLAEPNTVSKSIADTETMQSTAASSSSDNQSNVTKSDENKSVKTILVNALEAKQWNPNNPNSWEPDMREYHSLPESDYMLPSDGDEQNRLQLQHHIFYTVFEGNIVCPAAKELVKKSGTKILDVGCADGFWLQSVKNENPLPEYHGVDISEDLVNGVSVENDGVNLTFGNVLTGLPYKDNTFDYVHQRMLVLGIPKEKFPDALRELIRVTKPGGWIELLESDMVFYKGGSYTKTLGTAFFNALDRRGLDCYAATNLPWYVWKVNEHVTKQETKTVHIPFGWGSTVGDMSGRNGNTAMLGLEDWMHKAMGISREEYRELVQNCYDEWVEMRTFGQSRTIYFQVKK